MHEPFDFYDIGREISPITTESTPLSPEALKQAQEKIFPPSTEPVPASNIPWSKSYLGDI